uniref:SCP domain-containing protein n=1 Tax=Hydatigena taeniaeformis TaxID=6205 RepID=A0A0R3WZV2_HYDTA
LSRLKRPIKVKQEAPQSQANLEASRAEGQENRQPFIVAPHLCEDMWRLLLGFTVVMSYELEEMAVEDPKSEITELHMSIRNNFEFWGIKLDPFRYSRELENTAYKWVDTCETAPPLSVRYFFSEANVVSSPLFASVSSKWRSLMANESKAYNPATGECDVSTCDHYRRLIEPYYTEFACAVRYCPIGRFVPETSTLTVCLYKPGTNALIAPPFPHLPLFSAVVASSSDKHWMNVLMSRGKVESKIRPPTTGMERLLACFFAVMSCAYADAGTEKMKAGLIELHMSLRNNFQFRDEKLTPFTYSKELENLAMEWAKTCNKSEPKDPRYANLGNNVGSCPLYWPLVFEWSNRLSSQKKAYNPATGQCVGSPCEHYRQVVQPNNTKFGCAINVCSYTVPSRRSKLLSVCLYQAE